MDIIIRLADMNYKVKKGIFQPPCILILNSHYNSLVCNKQGDYL